MSAPNPEEIDTNSSSFFAPLGRLLHVRSMTKRLLILCCIALVGCRAASTKDKFDQFYAQWQRECQQPKVRIMSDTRVYTDLPGYRAIVTLGRPALPYLRDKMEHDSGFDFMLVYAVIEIEGWDSSSFGTPTGGVQNVRDEVLVKMRANE